MHKLGMVTHAYSASAWEAENECCMLEARIGYMKKAYFEMVHDFFFLHALPSVMLILHVYMCNS